MEIKKGVIFRVTHPSYEGGYFIFLIKETNAPDEGQGTIILEAVKSDLRNQGVKNYLPDEYFFTVEKKWFNKDTKREFEIVTKQFSLF